MNSVTRLSIAVIGAASVLSLTLLVVKGVARELESTILVCVHVLKRVKRELARPEKDMSHRRHRRQLTLEYKRKLK